MRTFLTCWIIFVLLSFAVGVLGLSWVQSRLIEKVGWRWPWQKPAYRIQDLFDLYWRDSTWYQRLLIWPGLIAFLLTLAAAALKHELSST